MQIRILNTSGDTLITDEKITGDRVKQMSTAEIKKEFDTMIKNGYVGVDEETHTTIGKLSNKNQNVTMLYPMKGG